jgi:hypothetical protein
MSKRTKAKLKIVKTKTRKPRTPSEPTNGTNELRDDELRALAINHKGLFERALAAKKAKDADFLNCTKRIKAELGKSGVAIIKAMVELDSDEGEAAVMERIRAQAKAARWSGLAIGTQIELQLSEPDRTPAVDRARDEGIKASMGQKPCKPPYSPDTEQYRMWMEGFHEHQATLAGKIGRGKGDDDKDVRPAFLQQREAERNDEKGEGDTEH